jgi:hypothetical protein
MLPSKMAPDILASVALLIQTAPPFVFLPIAELLVNLVFPPTRNDEDSLREIAPP